MKRLLIVIFCFPLLIACSGNKSGEEKKSDSFDAGNVYGDEKKGEPMHADDSKGVGKFTNVPMDEKLDAAMAESGLKVYELKCSACHKLTAEKLVGPGWKEVTKRRSVEWVMNFVTNTDEMLNKDPAAQAMLEECLVRMPNQNLTEGDARSVYEFMRKNDGLK